MEAVDTQITPFHSHGDGAVRAGLEKPDGVGTILEFPGIGPLIAKVGHGDGLAAERVLVYGDDSVCSSGDSSGLCPAAESALAKA